MERPLSEEPDIDVWILFSDTSADLDRSWAFRKLEAPRFQDMKVVRLSALRNGRLCPQEISLVLIAVGGWIDPRTTVRPEGLCQWKFTMTPSGIKAATFWLVAQCLNRADVWIVLYYNSSQAVRDDTGLFRLVQDRYCWHVLVKTYNNNNNRIHRSF